MDWRESVIDYCERRNADFWAEPLNALSNGAFIVAAVSAYALWRRRGAGDYPVLALIAVTASIGAGSFVFHTVATRGAMLLDVIPIAIFIYGYFFLALRRFFALGAAPALALTILFGVASYAIGESTQGLNGSIAYLPALVAIGLFSALLLWRVDALARQAAQGLAVAGVFFALSLLFRTIDRAICEAFAHGAHFLWHLLNALVLWLLLRVALDYATPSEKA